MADKRLIVALDYSNLNQVKDLVEECVKFSEESPYPEVQQLYDVVYEQENYPFIPHKL